MPKRRTNKHLPSRVYFKTGYYYFVDFEHKWHNLGKHLPDAMQKWSRIIERPIHMNTMNHLFDRYMLEVAPNKAPETYKDNLREVQNLRIVFGDMAPDSITPPQVYEYLDHRGAKAKTRANREKALLSHVYTMAIRWGIVNDNPCKHVKRLTEKKRNRYIEDHEFLTVRAHASLILQQAMDFAYITGLRKGDILTVKMSDLTDQGILVEVNKTGKKQLIEWSDALQACVQQIQQVAHGEYLFSARDGSPYTVSGFDTNWQKLMRRLHQDNIIKERFRFHDIRRKAATDAERAGGREFARQLLGHTHQAMTSLYISGAERVKPLK